MASVSRRLRRGLRAEVTEQGYRMWSERQLAVQTTKQRRQAERKKREG